jgi:hypothetical protein
MRSFSLDVEIDEKRWHGRARKSFNGPTLFMNVSF